MEGSSAPIETEVERTKEVEHVRRLCCGQLREAVVGDAVPVGLYLMHRKALRVSLVSGEGGMHPQESVTIPRCIFCEAKLDERRLGATDFPEARPQGAKVEPEA